jgi:hypothetical protein
VKRVLVIDDERVFPSFEIDGYEITYVRCSGDAMAALIESEWDEVWFDHDLGLDDNAMLVVKWMEFNPGVWHIDKAYVHSMNTVGATNVLNRLKGLDVPTQRVGLPQGSTII